MNINLANETDFNNFLLSLVYGEEKPRIPTKENLQDKEFVINNKHLVIRAMMAQWIKKNVRQYLTRDENACFLSRVTGVTEESPRWLKEVLATGKAVYSFNADSVPNAFYEQLQTVKDYLYIRGREYIKKKSKHINPRFNLDALKSLPVLSTFEKALAESQKWHQQLVTKRKKDVVYQEVLKGTEFVMALENELAVYKLTSKEALDYEGDLMRHCVGKGGYDENIATGKSEIYSIRDKNGEPHVTIELKNGFVHQCKGKCDRKPLEKYKLAVQEFIKSKQFDIKYDLKNIELIKEDKEYYSIYDFPVGLVLKKSSLNLSELNLENANLDIVTNVLYLRKSKLPKTNVLNLSGIKNVDLSGCDLSGYQEVRLPSDYVDLSECVFTSSPTEQIDKRGSLPKIDFSKTRHIGGTNVDFSMFDEINGPVGSFIMKGVKLPEKLTFLRTKIVGLLACDLSKVQEISGSMEVCIEKSILPEKLDLSKQRSAKIKNCDLSNVTELKLPSIVDFTETKLPRILDLSKIQKAYFSNADFSNVEEIKVPKSNASIIGLSSISNINPKIQETVQRILKKNSLFFQIMNKTRERKK